MTALTMRSMFAVAALAVAAGSASAQTYKARVPVSFEVSGKTMVAGSYTFYLASGASGAPILTVRSDATHRGAVLMANPGADAPKAWKDAGSPVIAFQCVGNNCALEKMWNGQSASTYAFPRLKVKAAESERLASITVALVKAD
jgi:hypothetical protein